MLGELWSFRGRYRILHMTWFAFFLTFVVWFNFAPFATTIAKDLGLTPEQVKTLFICNIALTIPARIIVGMILDRFGPRKTFAGILIFAIVPCLATAFCQNFNQLVISRLLISIVGAGFVVGIRMVSEWFPAKDIGIAQGIYGGWGNFGSFGAEFILPALALATAFLAEGNTNWRLAIACTGGIALVYGLIYVAGVRDTPPGKVYQRPKRSGGMEVTSIKSFWAMIFMNFGLIFGLGLLAWRLTQPGIAFLNYQQMLIVFFFLGCLYAYQTYQAWQVNRELFSGSKIYPPAERYEFSQVAILEFAYLTTFGAELSAVSMLPGFFENTFSLEHVQASMIAGMSYPLLNLISRPSGGLISDKLGSRKWTITIISAGMGFGYLITRGINSSWPILGAIAAIMCSAYFAQAGNGAIFGIVPLIKKPITGQIAGNVGAYGNLGGIIFLAIFSLSDANTLFAAIGVCALICAGLCTFFLKEPKSSFASDAQEKAIKLAKNLNKPS